MWIYDVYFKNGERKMYITQEPFIPREVAELSPLDIEDSYCDHIPMDIKDFETDLESFKKDGSWVLCEDVLMKMEERTD